MSMTVSVVIPAYNAGKYIARAIESVLAQSRRPDEIIVVDDGSTDDTAQIVAGFGLKVQLIRQDNGGASAARNSGIDAATGEWIAFLDADDEWLGEKLLLQTQHLQQNSDLVWTCSNFYKCNCQQKHRVIAREPYQCESVLGDRDFFDDYLVAYRRGIFAWTGTVMVKRQAFDEVGLFQVGQIRGQDTDMWFRLAYSYPQFGYITEPLAVYHCEVQDSATKKFRSMAFLSDAINRHLELSAEHGKSEQFRHCATKMLQRVIREQVSEEPLSEILELTQEFKDFLSFRFRMEMRLRVKHRRIAPVCLGISSGIKKLLHRLGS